MPRAPLLAILTVLFALIVPATATATAPGAGTWQEAHQTNGDVRVTVGADGVALFRHRIRLRIVAGRFKYVDLLGLDPRGEVASDVRVLPEKGSEIAGRAEPSPKVPGATRLTFDDPKGLSRGVYTIDVSYRMDLIATDVLVRDGGLLKLAWTSPAAAEGVDGARVVFDLPAAKTPPRLASVDDAPTTVVTIDRGTERDEVELLRARVPRGEAVTWALRVDPNAFASSRADALAPPKVSPRASVDPSGRDAARGAAALAGLALVWLLLASAKRRSIVARAARIAPVLPVPTALLPFLHATAAVSGALCLVSGHVLVSGAAFLLAILLATYRTAQVPVSPRGPGRWKEVADADVLVPSPVSAVDPFDVGTRAGKLALLLLGVSTLASSLLLVDVVPFAHVALPLAALTLVPLFVTGTRAQEPRSPAALAAEGLAPARDALARIVDLAHVDLAPIARVKEGSVEIDEVRLACAPAIRIPGLRGIELALATSQDAWVAPPPSPEVLVRYEDGSSAGAKIARIARGMPVVVGRSPDEKVLRVSPRVPTPEGAARLVARLLGELEGRRTSDLAPIPAEGGEPRAPSARPGKGRRYRGPERRLPGRRPATVTRAGGAQAGAGTVV